MNAETWYNYRYDKPDREWAEMFRALAEKEDKDIGTVEDIKKDMPENCKEMRMFLIRHGSSHDAQLVASWMTGELMKILNYHDLSYGSFKDQMTAKEELIWHKWMEHFFNLLENDQLTDQNGEKVLRRMVAELEDPYSIAFEEDFFKEDLNLEKIVEQTIKQNTEAVQDYRNGNEDAINHLIGAVMSETNGKADPQKTTTLLQETL